MLRPLGIKGRQSSVCSLEQRVALSSLTSIPPGGQVTLISAGAPVRFRRPCRAVAASSTSEVQARESEYSARDSASPRAPVRRPPPPPSPPQYSPSQPQPRSNGKAAQPDFHREPGNGLSGPPQRKGPPQRPQRPDHASNGSTYQPREAEQAADPLTDPLTSAEPEEDAQPQAQADGADWQAPAAAGTSSSPEASASPRPPQAAAATLKEPPRRPNMLKAPPQQKPSASPDTALRPAPRRAQEQSSNSNATIVVDRPASQGQLEADKEAMLDQKEFDQEDGPEREAVKLAGPPKRSQATVAAAAAAALSADAPRRPDMRRAAPTSKPESDAAPADRPDRPSRSSRDPRGRGGASSHTYDEEIQPSTSRRGMIDEMRMKERDGDRPQQQRRRKVDASAKRHARADRRAQREEERSKNALEQEEIFEIGTEGMSVAELSQRLAVRAHELLAKLFERGIAAQVNQVLDRDTVKSLAEEYDVVTLDREEADEDKRAKKAARAEEEEEDLHPRPPVVTVMGHVDHGKTSLLDYIRKAKVAAGEAGGITQAIGAYTCELPPTEDGEGPGQITFLDTPGHEAFSAMRARGTRVTDIAVIVVAADDGVRPQTSEAIAHAHAAEVPIVVAINKIDKDGANIERVKQELSEAGLLPEEWGGKTPMVAISAKKGQNVDSLLETVLLMAEVEAFSANPDKPAEGTVIEAHMDRNTGAVATLLVSSGTLRAGDAVAAGAAYGKVRVMRDSLGPVSEARPSFAVQMTGLSSLPTAGDDFVVCSSEAEARKRAAVIIDAMRQDRLTAQAGSSMISSRSTFASLDEDAFDQPTEELKLNLIMKTDTSGSVEALKSALGGLPQERIGIRFLHAAAGPVTAADVDLAAAAEGSLVIAFNTTVSESVLANAKNAGVDVRSYSIIYELIDEVRAAMEGELGLIEERVPLGTAAVRAVFGAGSRRVAGCMITEGMLKRDAVVEVKRGSKTVYEGKIVSLRRVKDDVKEIASGQECGVGVEDFAEWREGDQISAFELVNKPQSLEIAA